MNFVKVSFLRLFRLTRILCRWMWYGNFGRDDLDDTTKTAQDDDWAKVRTNCQEFKVNYSSNNAGDNLVARLFGVLVTLCFVGFIVYLIYLLLLSNVNEITTNIEQYKMQVTYIQKYISFYLENPKFIRKLPVPDAVKAWILHHIKSSKFSANSLVSDLMPMLKSLLKSTKNALAECVFFFLYVLFMLLSPKLFPTSEDSGDEIQENLVAVMASYVRVKTFSNLMFGTATYFLLVALGISLSMVMAVISFFLAFIPEIGAIISIFLPIPLIFLAPPKDGKYETPAHNMPTNPYPDFPNRMYQLVWFLLGMLAIKMLISNLIESWMISKNPVLSGAIKRKGKKLNESCHEWCVWVNQCWRRLRGRVVEERVTSAKDVLLKLDQDEKAVEEMHPVTVLFGVVIWGQIWGTTGMLISVPLLSIMKVVMNVWEESVRRGLKRRDGSVP